MLKYLVSKKSIELVSDEMQTVIVKSLDNSDYRVVELLPFEWKKIDKFAKEVSFVPFMKGKLKQGQHASPPAGYPKDPSEYAVPHFYMFPLDSKERVHSALAYFNKHTWRPEEHKEEAAKRILRAAKKFHIEVSPDDDVSRAAKTRKKVRKENIVGTNWAGDSPEPVYTVNG
jgi:hypothetical protein